MLKISAPKHDFHAIGLDFSRIHSFMVSIFKKSVIYFKKKKPVFRETNLKFWILIAYKYNSDLWISKIEKTC